jgi:hypothetical protein
MPRWGKFAIVIENVSYIPNHGRYARNQDRNATQFPKQFVAFATKRSIPYDEMHAAVEKAR